MFAVLQRVAIVSKNTPDAKKLFRTITEILLQSTLAVCLVCFDQI